MTSRWSRSGPFTAPLPYGVRFAGAAGSGAPAKVSKQKRRRGNWLCRLITAATRAAASTLIDAALDEVPGQVGQADVPGQGVQREQAAFAEEGERLHCGGESGELLRVLHRLRRLVPAADRVASQVLRLRPVDAWIGKVLNRLHIAAPRRPHHLHGLVHRRVPAPVAKVIEPLRHIGRSKVVEQHQRVFFCVGFAGHGVLEGARGVVVAVDEKQRPLPVALAGPFVDLLRAVAGQEVHRLHQSRRVQRAGDGGLDVLLSQEGVDHVELDAAQGQVTVVDQPSQQPICRAFLPRKRERSCTGYAPCRG